MINMIHDEAVRPLPSPTTPGGEGGGGATTGMQLADDDEIADLKLALTGEDDAIIGIERVIHDGDRPGAIPAKPLRAPNAMTPRQKAIHDLTHQPPHPGCVICRSNRAANMKHSASHEHRRTIPFLVGD